MLFEQVPFYLCLMNALSTSRLPAFAKLSWDPLMPKCPYSQADFVCWDLLVYLINEMSKLKLYGYIVENNSFFFVIAFLSIQRANLVKFIFVTIYDFSISGKSSLGFPLFFAMCNYSYCKLLSLIRYGTLFSLKFSLNQSIALLIKSAQFKYYWISIYQIKDKMTKCLHQYKFWYHPQLWSDGPQICRKIDLSLRSAAFRSVLRIVFGTLHYFCHRLDLCTLEP